MNGIVKNSRRKQGIYCTVVRNLQYPKTECLTLDFLNSGNVDEKFKNFVEEKEKVFLKLQTNLEKLKRGNLYLILFQKYIKIFFSIIKVSYYFQKCCFNADAIDKRTECDRLSCEGKYTEFTLFFHEVNNTSFYYLNRKQLEEYWKCIVKDREDFCPEKCNKCDVCELFSKAYEELKDSWFFTPNKSLPYQPFLWRIFTKDQKNNSVFRTEIAKTVKATGRVYHGETC